MGTDLNDLRNAALEREEEGVDINTMVASGGDERLFGMTAIERMFVSIGCFVLTSAGGFLLLLVLDKISV